MPSDGHTQQLHDDRQRDAWLDEMWAPVREYRRDAGDHQAALARREQLATFFGDEPASHDQPHHRPLRAA